MTIEDLLDEEYVGLFQITELTPEDAYNEFWDSTCYDIVFKLDHNKFFKVEDLKGCEIPQMVKRKNEQYTLHFLFNTKIKKITSSIENAAITNLLLLI